MSTWASTRVKLPEAALQPVKVRRKVDIDDPTTWPGIEYLRGEIETRKLLRESLPDYPAKCVRNLPDMYRGSFFAEFCIPIDISNMELCTLVFTLESVLERLMKISDAAGEIIVQNFKVWQLVYVHEPAVYGKHYNKNSIPEFAQELKDRGIKYIYIG